MVSDINLGKFSVIVVSDISLLFFFLHLVFPSRLSYIYCSYPTVLEYLICLGFFSVFVFFAIWFSKILLIYPLGQGFFSVMSSLLINLSKASFVSVTMFCFVLLYLWHFFLLFFFRISSALLTLAICSCMLCTLSIRALH